MTVRPRYSVLVVGFRTADFVLDCLGSILRDPRSDLEVLFLDNASPEDEASLVLSRLGSDPRLSVHTSESNLFFAGGMNRLAQLAKGDLLVLINPDSLVGEGFFGALDRHGAERPVEVAMGEIRRLGMDELQTAGIALDRIGLVHQLPRDRPFPRSEIFGANGACFIVRREIFESLGGFDESFEMYFEETDFCWRAWLAGFHVERLPGVVLHHAEGGSSIGAGGSDKRQFRFVRNRLVSLHRHADPGDLAWILPLHVAALVCLSALWFVRGRRAKARATLAGLLAGIRILRGTRGRPSPGETKRTNRDLRRRGIQRGLIP